MDDIGGNFIQKPDKVSAHRCDVAAANNPPGVVTDDQTGHSLLGNKIALNPLYGCPIQLWLFQQMAQHREAHDVHG